MSMKLRIDSGWTGGNTRNQPASVFVDAVSGAKFDVGAGVRYYVTPGEGWYDHVEVIGSLSLTDTRFEVNWIRTGGQNHTFELKFQDDNATTQGGSTGPKDYRSQTYNSLTFHIQTPSRTQRDVTEEEFDATAGGPRNGITSNWPTP
jgi:hypothetical protein